MEKEDIVSIPKEFNPSIRKKVSFANNYSPKANFIKTLRKKKCGSETREQTSGCNNSGPWLRLHGENDSSHRSGRMNRCSIYRDGDGKGTPRRRDGNVQKNKGRNTTAVVVHENM